MIVYPEEIMSAKIKIMEEALKRIEEFGHSHGHARGYSCANIAEEALDKAKKVGRPNA